MRAIVVIFSAAIIASIGHVQAVTVLPKVETFGERMGRSVGNGISKGFAESYIEVQQIKKDQLLREQLQLEERIAAEVDIYNAVLLELSCASSHPKLTLPLKLTESFNLTGKIVTSKMQAMKYEGKIKFNRVLSDGALVEWLWSFDLRNVTSKAFFSSGFIQHPKTRFKIDLLDENNFLISTCIYYKDVVLNRGKSMSLQGKWVIPYDQVKNVASCNISIG
jgi:hypothetical protein